MKNFPLIIIVCILIAAGILFVYRNQDTTDEAAVVTGQEQSGDNARLVRPNPDTEIPENQLKRVSFTGNLEQVNTGCFVDGECYVVVDGKHVTAILGWTGGRVGSIEGVGDGGFGELEKHIGKTVQVYGHEKADGTYTLYGAEEFYIKVL